MGMQENCTKEYSDMINPVKHKHAILKKINTSMKISLSRYPDKNTFHSFLIVKTYYQYLFDPRCILLYFKVIYIELSNMQVPFKFNLNRMKKNVNLFHVNPLY